jgi:hypothetical protein
VWLIVLMLSIVAYDCRVARTCFVGPREGYFYPIGRVSCEEFLPLEPFVVLYMVVFSCI